MEPIDTQPVTPSAEFIAGARASLPLAIGAMIFGVTLGVTASQVGLTAVEMGFMSATVFAGASQLVAVGMIDQAAPALAIIAAVFAVNARHILMGATIVPLLRGSSTSIRSLSLLLLVDETWALSMARAGVQPTGPAYIIGAGSFLYLCWLTSTLAGIVFGDLVPDPRVLALDFLGVAVFIGLLAYMKPTRQDIVPFAIAAILSPLIAAYLPGSWNIILAATVAASYAAVRS